MGLCAIWSTFYFSGLVAYATYKDCDPLTLGRIEKPDQILPYLVMDKLDHLTGVPGIFVAAVYGGVLRSVLPPHIPHFLVAVLIIIIHKEIAIAGYS